MRNASAAGPSPRCLVSDDPSVLLRRPGFALIAHRGCSGEDVSPLPALLPATGSLWRVVSAMLGVSLWPYLRHLQSSMDFLQVIEQVCAALDRAAVRYALIGGFAMAMRGVQRATLDLDFILMLEDLERADHILCDAGYRRAFHSENVSHYVSDDSTLGRIDLLHAFRAPSLSMLARADRIEVTEHLSLPVVQAEDIIGLKIQATLNDARRQTADWADIRLLIEAAAQNGEGLDWELIEDYLTIFELEREGDRMRSWYDETVRG